VHSIKFEKLNENQEHFKHILLFYYKKEKNVAQTKEKICRFYGKNDLTRQTANWFCRFWDENFDVKNVFCSGRPGKMSIKFCKKLKKKSSWKQLWY